MKAQLFQIIKTASSSFKIQEDSLPHFYDRLHYHPEFQLTYIIESRGTLFAGDGIQHFETGQLLLFGTNLPHVLRNDEEWYKMHGEQRARAISVYFSKEAFGEAFFELPEVRSIRLMLKNAQQGLLFDGTVADKLKSKMQRLPRKKNFKSMLALFEILDVMSADKNAKTISSAAWLQAPRDADHERINAVFTYIMDHYQEVIRLQDVAEIAHMSETAFCRFFRNRTRLTFSAFLMEIRIGQACRLLMEEGYQVSEVAYKCGYRNLSNFNRQFKTVKKCAPSQFLKMHQAGTLLIEIDDV